MSKVVVTGSITIVDLNDTGVLGWTPVLGGTVSQDGSTFTKVGGVTSWDTQVTSKECYTAECYCSCRAGDITKYVMFGLNSDPLTDAGYTSIDYAWYLDGSSTHSIRESGTAVSVSGNYNTTTVLSIVYDGINVIYYKDSLPVRTVARTIGLPLYFDSSFNTVGAKLTVIDFGPVSARPAIYSIDTSLPVITKQSPDAATDGVYSSIIVTGRRNVNGMITNYGYPVVNADNAQTKFWTPVLSSGIDRSLMSFSKAESSISWNSQVYSATGYTTTCTCSAQSGDLTKYAMFGLNSDPTTNASYASIDYCWYLQANTVVIYESGVLIGSFGTITPSTVLSITYDGTNIIYYKDGVAQRTVARAIGATLYFDSSLRDLGSTLTDVKFYDYTGSTVWNNPVVSANCVCSDSTYTKTRNTDLAYNEQIYSDIGYVQSCYCSAQIGDITKQGMFGLNSDPTTDATYITLDYCWFFISTGTVRIFESNVDIGTNFGAITTNTVLSIIYDGVNVIYYKDGVPVRTVARAIGLPLYFDSSFRDIGATLTDIDFGPLSTLKLAPANTDDSSSYTIQLFNKAPYLAGAALLDTQTIPVIFKGATGTSVYTGTVYVQQASAPSTPTGGSYNFTTSVLTPPSGWSITQPTTTTVPTWATDFLFSGSGTVAGGTWGTPYVEAQNGTNGVSTAIVYIYIQQSTVPTTPTGGTWTFSTSTLSSVPSGWSVAQPTTTTVPTYISRRTFTATTPTDTSTTGSWSTPTIHAQNGTNGSNGNRGAGFYSVAGTAWSDSVANAACPGGLPVLNDVVTIYNSSTLASYGTKMWSGSVWATPALAIHGDMIATGTIRAAAISTPSLSALSANLGTITAGMMQTTSSNVGMKVDLTNNCILVYDESGVLRVKMGLL